ncbi:hypothetical protein ACQP1O_43280 (plasmid) [Nocardia sp. CA-151230]|uniref:hypothetical protein n=1 Tax=Nocardia sp. CA-151230 TaxID=3239982 RepID=UPI003D93EE55
MSFDALSEVLTGVGGAGIGGLATGLFGRRKAKADEAAVLSSVAVSLVQPLHNEIAGLRDELGTVRTELAAHKRATEEREAARRVAMVAHTEWDTNMAGRLRDAGFDVPEPPPLSAA